MLPLLRRAAAAKGEVNVPTLLPELARDFSLKPEELEAKLSSGRQTILANRYHWAQIYMRRAGLLESQRRGYFTVTPRGHQLLAENPAHIDRSVLTRRPS